MKNTLEAKAAKILEDNPDKNVVFISETGQAFFNKAAAKNHEKKRKDKVTPIYRQGFEPNTEVAETLEEVQEALAERSSVVECIKKVVGEDDHGIEVNDSTDEVIAAVVDLKERALILSARNSELTLLIEELESDPKSAKKSN